MLDWIKTTWEKFKGWIIAGVVTLLVIFFWFQGADDKVKKWVKYFMKQKEKRQKKIKKVYEKKQKKKDEELKKIKKEEEELKKERKNVEKNIESKDANKVASEFLHLGY